MVRSSTGAGSRPTATRPSTQCCASDPQSGLRDFEAVNALAEALGLALVADHAMPANNQLLVWR
jgi:hypothetical protein